MDRQDIKRGPGNEPTPHDCRAIQAERDALRVTVATMRAAVNERASERDALRAEVDRERKAHADMQAETRAAWRAEVAALREALERIAGCLCDQLELRIHETAADHGRTMDPWNRDEDKALMPGSVQDGIEANAAARAALAARAGEDGR